ncbi:MAG: ABC transporter ATP-binding protein [Thermoprotei archaeon]
MITFSEVSYTYPGTQKQALCDFSYKIERGSAVAVVGSNGAGKSTVVKLCNGILKPSSGTVSVDGVSTTQATVAQLARKVAVVFQNPSHQIFETTVHAEVAFALRNFGFSPGEQAKLVKEALAKTGLSDLAGRSPFSLSSGEKKRLTIACAIAYDPEALVFDEPTVGQDMRNREAIGSMIAQYASRGRSVLVVTHDMEFVLRFFKRVVVLDRGRIVAEGEPVEVLSNSALTERARLVTPDSLLLRAYGRRLGVEFDGDIAQFAHKIARRLCP